ncbi:MAG: hypothetical protein ACP5RM_00500 [Candidatus Micrarchaeia archaeon]
MTRIDREKSQKKALKNLIEDLKCGIVVVEGDHDVETLKNIGITNVFKFDQIKEVLKSEIINGKTLYIIMDNDKGGSSKEKATVKILRANLPEVKYNLRAKEDFLGILNITSVEEAYPKAIKILRRDC